MCGLFGVAGNQITKKEFDTCRDLAIISSLRGIDSTGVATLSLNKKNQFYHSIYKSTYSASEWLQTNQGKEVFSFNNGLKFLIGHCRAATIGEISFANAHPFIHNNIIGAHNGTVRSLSSQNKTDSQFIIENISKEGIENTVNNKIKEGSFALSWIDTSLLTLNFIRNSQRTLYWCKTKSKVVYWASEKGFLELALNRNKETIDGEITPFEENSLYSLSTENFNWTINKVKEVKYNYTITRYSSRNNKKDSYPYSALKKAVSFLFFMPVDEIKNRKDWIKWMNNGCSWCNEKNIEDNNVFVELGDLKKEVVPFMCSKCKKDYEEYIDIGINYKRFGVINNKEVK